MTGFEWHTTNEDEAIWRDTRPDAFPLRRRQWPRLVVLCLLAVGLAILVQHQIRMRLAAVQAAVQAEITATGTLLQDAATAGDQELFTTLLSGRDPDWTEAQQQIVARNLFMDRPALNLRLRLGAGVAVSTTIQANLQAAEQIARYAYTMETPSGETQTITLQQLTIFRQGEQRWLYAPPDADFWGPWQVAQGTRLMMSFPERDEILARRLLADLDELVTELCALSTPAGCRPGRFLWVRFSPEPDSLLFVERPDALVRTGRRLVLPTPTLVGLPVDERGYQALLGGYAPYIAARVVAKQVQWQCCLDGGDYPGILIYEALLREYLHQRGLLPRPVAASPSLAPPIQAAELSTLWSVSPSQMNREGRDQAQTLVAHLLDGHLLDSHLLDGHLLDSRPDPDLLGMMQAIGDYPRGEGWYSSFFTAAADSNSSRRWDTTINSE